MKKHLIEVALLFLAFYLPGYFASSLLPEDLTPYMLRYLWVAVPQFFLILYILWVQGDPPLVQFGLARITGIDILLSLGLLVLLLTLFLSVGFLINLLPESLRDSLGRGYRWKSSSPAHLPLVLLFCLATGYREELFFRAYLLTRLPSMGMGVPLSVGLSTSLFALGHHYEGPEGITLALVQGILFSFIFIRRRNLHILSLTHGLYNFTLLLASAAG